MRLKKNKRISILFWIVLFVYIFLFFYGKKYTNEVSKIVQASVNEKTYHYIFNVFDRDSSTNPELMKIISIETNKQGEIISVDYRFHEAYRYLNYNMKRLYDNLQQMDLSTSYIQEKDGLLWIPSMIVTKNVLLSHMGLKIPVKIDLLKSIDMNFRTEAKEYGINNVLVELYLDIRVTTYMICMNEEISFSDSYEIVVASRLITGKIPDYYNGIMEKTSTIVSS
mgnify:CR=1 FL=1